MQNIDAWKPTKFRQGKRGWKGTSDPGHLHVASRYTAICADWARRTRHGLKAANKVSFFLLEKGPLRRFSDRSMGKMPLGHVVVAQKPGRVPSA